jgi:hypothetical protein
LISALMSETRWPGATTLWSSMVPSGVHATMYVASLRWSAPMQMPKTLMPSVGLERRLSCRNHVGRMGPRIASLRSFSAASSTPASHAALVMSRLRTSVRG